MTHLFRVFLASPGDVKAERQALGRVVDEVNITIAPVLNCRLEAVLWETHATPDGGRPQAVINDQLSDYDIFIGLLWRRIGTRSAVARSGTEEEIQIAYRRWQQQQDMPLMIYFCQAPFYPTTVDEVDQMREVLLFRQELAGKALTWTYDDHAGFEPTIRQHLAQRLPKLVQARDGVQLPRTLPDDATIDSLRAIWPRLDPQVQRAVSIAYNENRRAGDPGIKTPDLFSALQRVGDDSLQQVIAEIPSAALPPATPGPVTDEAYILEERPWLSNCVSASIRRLAKAVPDGRQISPTDIFADIAKHGTGDSVLLLRKHQVRPADIDAILHRHNLSVIAT